MVFDSYQNFPSLFAETKIREGLLQKKNLDLLSLLTIPTKLDILNLQIYMDLRTILYISPQTTSSTIRI